MATNAEIPPNARALLLINQGDDNNALIMLSLGNEFLGGKIVERAEDFFGMLQGNGEIASLYTMENWFSGMMSGALFAFRTLKSQRRNVLIHQLRGQLSSSGMQALADGTATAIAKLLNREPLPTESDPSAIRCEVLVEALSHESMQGKSLQRAAG